MLVWAISHEWKSIWSVIRNNYIPQKLKPHTTINESHWNYLYASGSITGIPPPSAAGRKYETHQSITPYTLSFHHESQIESLVIFQWPLSFAWTAICRRGGHYRFLYIGGIGVPLYGKVMLNVIGSHAETRSMHASLGAIIVIKPLESIYLNPHFDKTAFPHIHTLLVFLYCRINLGCN